MKHITKKPTTIGALIALGYPRHACAARKTASKNTKPNKYWNPRPAKSLRQNFKYAKLNALRFMFKMVPQKPVKA